MKEGENKEKKEKRGKGIRKICFQMKCRKPVTLFLESFFFFFNLDFPTGRLRDKDSTKQVAVIENQKSRKHCRL